MEFTLAMITQKQIHSHSALVNAGACAGPWGLFSLSPNSSELFRECLDDLVAYGCVVQLKDNTFQISNEATKFIIRCVATKVAELVFTQGRLAIEYKTIWELMEALVDAG